MMLSDEVLYSPRPMSRCSVLTRQSEDELLAWIEAGTVQRAVSSRCVISTPTRPAG